MGDSKEHAVCSASGMHRWEKCPGSINLTKNLPPVTNKYAELGTKAHSIVSDILLRPWTGIFYDVMEPSIMEHAWIYVNLVREESKDAEWVAIEKKFSLETLWPGLFGTTDAVTYHAGKRKLTIYDYKHGVSKVEVEGNVQLLYYALGALLHIRFAVDEIELVVVQPRAPGDAVRRWAFPRQPAMGEFKDRLVQAVMRTEDPNAEFVMGKWCFFCPGPSICPEKKRAKEEQAMKFFGAA